MRLRCYDLDFIPKYAQEPVAAGQKNPPEHVLVWESIKWPWVAAGVRKQEEVVGTSGCQWGGVTLALSLHHSFPLFSLCLSVCLSHAFLSLSENEYLRKPRDKGNCGGKCLKFSHSNSPAIGLQEFLLFVNVSV